MDPVPVSQRTLTEVIRQHEAALVPADRRLVGVELDRLGETHGYPEGWDARVGVYLEAFEDVPADLVLAACKWGRLRSKWFPKPAELLAEISAELAARRHTLRRLTTACAVAGRGADDGFADARDRSPEQVANAERAFAEARRALSSGSPDIRRMTVSRDDTRAAGDDSVSAARRRVAAELAGRQPISRETAPMAAE